MADQLAWIKKVTVSLPEEKVRAKISDDNPRWEFIDGEMVKLGSLGHGSLNLAAVQQEILTLLAEETKDFRLVVHLLRTLQHGGQPQDVILAVQILNAWVEHYWSAAWPHKLVMKRRLAQQAIKRFSAVAGTFFERTDYAQHQEMRGELARLVALWRESESTLAKDAEGLETVFRDKPVAKRVVSTTISDTSPEGGVIPVPSVEIESHDDKAWRHTQLKMAEILCERQPDSALGYRLRRNAIWNGITHAPQAQPDGRTPLAAFSTDRMAEYVAKKTNPDRHLWLQIEQSLTLAPYWFDGHYLSAAVAQQLGYDCVAGAIREELQLFLQRLPQLKTLLFNDHTPFLSPQAHVWLDDTSAEKREGTTDRSVAISIDQDAIWQCWQQQGLEAALQAIDDVAQRQNPRGQFYCQLLSTRLLGAAGMNVLAQQSYKQLYQLAQGITLTDWEPELIMLLAEQQHNHSEG